MMKASTANFRQLVGLNALLHPHFEFKKFLCTTDSMSYGEKDGLFTFCSMIKWVLKSSTAFAPFPGKVVDEWDGTDLNLVVSKSDKFHCAVLFN